MNWAEVRRCWGAEVKLQLLGFTLAPPPPCSPALSEFIPHLGRSPGPYRFPAGGCGGDYLGPFAGVDQGFFSVQDAVLKMEHVSDDLVLVTAIRSKRHLPLRLPLNLVEDDPFVHHSPLFAVDTQTQHRQRRFDDPKYCQNAAYLTVFKFQVDKEVVF